MGERGENLIKNPPVSSVHMPQNPHLSLARLINPNLALLPVCLFFPSPLFELWRVLYCYVSFGSFPYLARSCNRPHSYIRLVPDAFFIQFSIFNMLSSLSYGLILCHGFRLVYFG